MRRADRGDTSVEAALLVPLLLVLTLGLLQVGMYGYGRSLVHAAAQEGSRAGAREGSTTATATRAATGFLAQAGKGILVEPGVSASRTPSTVTVTVTAATPSIVPGVTGWPARATVSMPVERVT